MQMFTSTAYPRKFAPIRLAVSSRSVSEYSEIVFQKRNGLCATWNPTTTCSAKSDYSDTLLDGQLQRAKKPQQIRGLNQNHNHEMKEIFKGTATRASCGVGPWRDFYVALLAKGMKREMARLTLARNCL